jgi:hypothetical protein
VIGPKAQPGAMAPSVIPSLDSPGCPGAPYLDQSYYAVRSPLGSWSSPSGFLFASVGLQRGSNAHATGMYKYLPCDHARRKRRLGSRLRSIVRRRNCAVRPELPTLFELFTPRQKLVSGFGACHASRQHQANRPNQSPDKRQLEQRFTLELFRDCKLVRHEPRLEFGQDRKSVDVSHRVDCGLTALSPE